MIAENSPDAKSIKGSTSLVFGLCLFLLTSKGRAYISDSKVRLVIMESQLSGKFPYQLLTDEKKNDNEKDGHQIVDAVKYLNEKEKYRLNDDERPLVECDYEAKKHLQFGKSVYDPPGGAAKAHFRTTQDHITITSLSDFIPSYKLRHRSRIVVALVVACIFAALLVILVVGLHFGTQKFNAFQLVLEPEYSKLNTSCGREEFQCNNNTSQRLELDRSCIPQEHVCDRKKDCPDGADETNCNYSCPDGQFACRTGVITRWPFRGYCLEWKDVCNGQVECSDGSDEERCPAESCRVDEFRCEKSVSDEHLTCLPKRQQCDRVVDCADGSDEANCKYSCPRYAFMCTTGILQSSTNSHWPEYCLSAAKVCDGISHCVDRSDELNCTSLCLADEFFCKKGFSTRNSRSRCIARSLVCDRRIDCTDNSDENNCTYACPSDMEACRTGTLRRDSSTYCYGSHRRCDSFRDCEDGSDEDGCQVLCADSEFKCRTEEETSMETCVPKERICDGHRDCLDGSDENACEMKCPSGQMSCEDDAEDGPLTSTCISLSQKCDGQLDCSNGKDEKDCHDTCDVEQFRCVNGVTKFNGSACLEKIYFCDRVEDCTDGSDEQMCHYICPEGMFPCDSGTLWDPDKNRELRGYCLPEEFNCDGIKQCSDGSDEARCPCRKGQFKCHNGKNTYDLHSQCIDAKHLCDGVPDCTDTSDEKGCTYKRRRDCTKLDKASIIKLRCDGHVDCTNGEDEKHCDISCASDQFRCASSVDKFTGSVCIRREYKCDRVEDCADGSDEKGCEYACPKGMFMCATKALYDETAKQIVRGFCISKQLKCDGHKQCVDGSDEKFCSCSNDQFRCHSGRNNFIHTSRCVAREHVCDKIADCSDSSDELDCHYASTTCDYFDMKIRCDGVVNCANGEDEENCDILCSGSEFRCKTGVDRRTGSVCVNNEFRCDRMEDCVDGSDEDPSLCNYTCPRGTLPCKSSSLRDPVTGIRVRGFCFEETSKCDGVVHCMDGTDEEFCPCKEGEFKCTNGFNIYSRVSRCIPLRHRCDFTPDCTDSSDELNCD